MKKLLAIGLLALIPLAHADEEQEKILGAVAGGYLGSTIGGGDGKKIATVLGAIIGYRAGPQVLGNNQNYTYYTDRQQYYYHPRQPRYRQADVYRLCDRENPYPRDSRFYWSYNRGCVQRMSEQIREMELRAYERGYQGH